MKRWEKDFTSNPRARLTNPSRAIWSRIDNMKKIRSEAGGKTIVQWVRAHIEEQTDKPKKEHKPKQSKKESSKSKQQKAETQDPKGKPKPTHRQPRKHKPPPPPTCACGQPKGKCDKNHPHHIGNELADTEANRGRKGVEPSQDEREDPRHGEDPWHLTHRNTQCEGDITTVIKQAIRLTRLTDMQNSSKPHCRRVAAALTLSDQCIRKYTTGKKAIPTRFIARALSDALPTYKNESKKVGEANSYAHMYGTHIEGGLCSCGAGEVEDNYHMFCRCKYSEHINVPG